MHVRTTVAAVVGAAIACVIQSGTVPADHAPVIIVPGRPDVPVIINGRDASGAIVEGDWGLYRAGAVAPTVIQRCLPPCGLEFSPGRYFPGTGQTPGRGRVEVDPASKRAPRPAETFYRVWTSQSDPGPVTISPSYDMPPIIVAPQVGPPRWPGRHRP